MPYGTKVDELYCVTYLHVFVFVVVLSYYYYYIILVVDNFFFR